jgi:hypothetical protein
MIMIHYPPPSLPPSLSRSLAPLLHSPHLQYVSHHRVCSAALHEAPQCPLVIHAFLGTIGAEEVGLQEEEGRERMWRGCGEEEDVRRCGEGAVRRRT